MVAEAPFSHVGAASAAFSMQSRRMQFLSTVCARVNDTLQGSADNCCACGTVLPVPFQGAEQQDTLSKAQYAKMIAVQMVSMLKETVKPAGMPCIAGPAVLLTPLAGNQTS
jgi:hypothetical protein